MVALFLATALTALPASPASARTDGRASVTILPGAEIHFERQADRAEQPFEHATIRGEDGISRPALLVEFQ